MKITYVGTRMEDQIPSHPLAPMLRKLQQWKKLAAHEQEAVLALPCKVEIWERHRSMVRESGRPKHSCLLISGFAFSYRLVADGSRSISAIHMRGDLVDLQNALLRNADHSVQTLTRCTVGLVPRDAIREVAFAFPNVGTALWYDTLVDASIVREWLANNARRNALARIAHLLCEIGLRLEAAGLSDKQNYDLPVTQEQLADCTGLTTVHVNRMLKALQENGAIKRSQRHVTIRNWNQLCEESDFKGAYLHLPEDDTGLS